MKLSVSLPEEDVAVLDAYVREHALSSRSAAVQKAVRMLRHPRLEQEYAEAWQEWESSGEQALWGAAVGDGLDRAAW